jgi:1-acyl-sn-glycerol-3-phosphate acyltransferase
MPRANRKMGISMESVISTLRFVTGFFVMAISVIIQFLLLLFAIPFLLVRIKACNYWGHVVGPMMMRVTGSPVKWVGKEKLSSGRPAIYVSNHTSSIDIFLGIWVAPVGTVGVAKKEIIYAPFFGQLYWLSGHLRLDRSNRERAIESMRALAQKVSENRLSIYIWPEGTRSRDGRLMKFKKGAFHLALQTKLPIIPIVVHGAHKCWEPKKLRIQPSPVQVLVLDPVDTSSWTAETLETHVEEVRQLFIANLPEEQRPLDERPAA